MLVMGEDPAKQRIKAESAAKTSLDNMFSLVAAEWLAGKKPIWSARYAAAIQHRIEHALSPQIGRLPINEIKASDLLALARKIEARGASSLASKTIQTAGQIIRYGIATGRCETDPSPGLRGALAGYTVKHHRSVKPKDLPALMAVISGYGIDQPGEESTRLALQLLALTFVRTRELIEATWDEFDLKNSMWKIDAPRMKMKREHWVPLSTPALRILERQKWLG